MMSEEERNYIIEQLDILISLAQEAQYQRIEGSEELITESQAALEKQRAHILSMDGIEFY
ncbi:hypothetical protein NCTGTJJY_CDS0114 [Serratia phage 92A1]|nr:hypothetical protein NCTGTJJY_CDS0114 [Serratia phage 92A1]